MSVDNTEKFTWFSKCITLSIDLFDTPLPSTNKKNDGGTTSGKLNSNIRSQKSKARRKRIEESIEQERAWLNFVNRNLEANAVGEIDPSLTRQMIPAMRSWARRKSLVGAKNAASLLDRYIKEYFAGNKATVLDPLPFNIVMDSWVKSGEEDAPQRVEDVLRLMQDLRRDHAGLSHTRPDVVSMSTLVAAWAKSGARNSASRAEGILSYMEEHGLSPNTITYNTVLHALAFIREEDRIARAESLLERMKKRYESGHDCRPDIFTYQSLITAWSRSRLEGAPQKAEELLSFLDEQKKAGHDYLAPNSHCFAASIHAWANSNEEQKARKAYSMLQTMRKLHEVDHNYRVRPNPIVFTSVINACASPVNDNEKEDAFQIAQLTMEELRHSSYGRPNFVTFAAFLNVCATTLPMGERRDTIVRQTFLDCCRVGHVSSLVVEKLEEAASPVLYQELLGGSPEIDFDGTRMMTLPATWTCNVRGEKRIKRKSRIVAKHLSTETLSRLKKEKEEQDDLVVTWTESSLK
eukprot:CAMPEP_0195303932 /NCGR_PEP_ID=MMETSP0707-20130614/33552_1 /TAXON_ID=33640 /ORGANISM="Asterionellopsis glacialis, Strain CCMP134" /LENGTH=520 /DNA_ID=CAMNT_0040367603 /DNA_START=202 /DNA_END=1765 /DNA_ORIENTATION=-